MPKVSVETVEHVARLAHLSLTAEEKESFARELQEILAYAETYIFNSSKCVALFRPTEDAVPIS